METGVNFSNFNVYFVLPKKYKKFEDCSDEMRNAFNTCIYSSDDQDFASTWITAVITEKKAMKILTNRNSVFVLESFEGESFSKLKSNKCKIVAPRCLLSCFFTGESIPVGTSPIINTPMRNMVVCASGFNYLIRACIQKKVEYMGGVYVEELQENVTHLITDSVTSNKYEMAAELNISIFRLKWLEAVWEKNLNDFLPANDSFFFQYKCPVFFSLIVAAANISKEDEDKVKLLINDNGGEFMENLDIDRVKVIITSESSTQNRQLMYAMQQNITCLNIKWIYDSIKTGYSLPFKNYDLKSIKMCSTLKNSTDYKNSSEGGLIDCLNDDCLRLIFGHLSISHRIKVEEVCKRWDLVSKTSWNDLRTLEINHDFEDEYSSVYDTTDGITELVNLILERCGKYLNDIKINFHDKSPLNYEQIMENLQKYCSNLNSLLLKDDFDWGSKKFFEKQVQLIFNNNKNLKKISLESLFLNGKCFSFIKNPKIIENLKLCRVGFQEKEPVIDFISKLENLKVLYSGTYDLDELAIQALCESHCNSITEIFFGIYKVSFIDDKILEFFSRQNKLYKIELNLNPLDEKLMNKIPESSLKEIIDIYFPESIPNSLGRFRNLVKLQCCIDLFTNKCMEVLITCEKIKELSLFVANYLLTSIGEKSFENLKNLEIFEFEVRNHNIDSLLVSLEKCTNVKYLKISHCKFTKVGVEGLSLLQNLIELNISYTIWDQESLINLIKKLSLLQVLKIIGRDNLSDNFFEKVHEIKSSRGDKHILKVHCLEYAIQEISFINLSPLVLIIDY